MAIISIVGFPLWKRIQSHITLIEYFLPTSFVFSISQQPKLTSGYCSDNATKALPMVLTVATFGLEYLWSATMLSKERLAVARSEVYDLLKCQWWLFFRPRDSHKAWVHGGSASCDNLVLSLIASRTWRYLLYCKNEEERNKQGGVICVNPLLSFK